MYRLLTAMFRDAYLSAMLGFKGGTACYFFYNLPRFSVDLDFDITVRKDQASVCNEVHRRIKDIIKAEGFSIKDEQLKRNTIFFVVSYEHAEHNIKIEISSRDYPNIYEIKDFYGASVRTLTKADMFAHKLVAATERKKTASRDFFDVWFFFNQGWPINEEIIKLRTGKDIKEYLGYLLKFADKYLTNRTSLQGIGELIDEKQKNWVKTKMKGELLGMIKFYMDGR